MHLITCMSAILAVIGGVSALPSPDPAPKTASPIQTADLMHVPQHVNNIPTEQDALLSYLFGWNSTAPQSKVARAKLWDDDDIVPIEELPRCYHKCVVDNCCNMASDGAPDIREMTTNDFCVRAARRPALLLLQSIWILLFLVFSAFSNLYYFCWLELIFLGPASWFTPDLSVAPNRVLGLSLLVISAFLKANCVGAWVQTLVITWFCDRKWRPPRSSKNIMQVEPSNWDDACERLGGCNLRISDRVYHCTRLGRCLPVYDHYCDFIKAAVYLRTIKAYLFVLVFLLLDAVFSITIAIYALARYQLRFAPFAISVIVAALVVVGGVAFFTWDKFWLLACKNCVYHENRVDPEWRLVFKYDHHGQTRLHILKSNGKHPWDLGIWENMHQVFGRHWWQWLFFWWQPERVSRYGHYADRDLPYGDWVTRYRTDFLMAPLNSVAVDAPGAPPSHGRAPPHRQQQQVNRHEQQRSSAVSRDNEITVHRSDVRRIQRSSGSSAGHAAGSAPSPPTHTRRRRLELSGSQQ
ncbi:hypothetical protein DL766_000809 [Monosporascus sp. MC13-8B]|uniref:Palmitoyltransferase n=1 Tax=Monosporascus cannonballus TaxID=155416 RepID=A0ABY0HHX4_9PEZI|nr:hypothetical protein DL762_001118 [Monosporascus cannonballus]RYO98395.1 hypothetical protein DL763_002234 [Monosporascus cannonballus]RYP38809.1 hypothetical protein DL766_000809 [Monosporascus sp. MC13-8B]